MYFFDYMFYRVAQFYVKTGLEKKDHEIYSRAVVSILQTINISTLLLLFSITYHPVFGGVLAVTIDILNSIFLYNSKKLKKYKERWDGEEKRIRKIKGVLIIIYMIASLILFVLAISTL